MLQPPVQAFRARVVETIAVVLLLTSALMLTQTFALSASYGHSSAQRWLESYRPVIYLSPETTSEAATRLREEIVAWPGVAQVRDRDPAQALKQLQDQLGTDHVRELGITEAMLPQSLIVEPAIPVAGHIGLVSRVAGLEARMEVDSVDIPSTGAQQTLALVRWLILLAGGLFALLGGAALLGIFGFLKRIQADEGQELALLEIFGATDAQLRRPTLARGLVLGLWGGMLAAAAMSIAVFVWQTYDGALLGQISSASVWTWLVIAVVSALGPAAGLIAGVMAVRSRRRPPQEIVKPLLKWGK